MNAVGRVGTVGGTEVAMVTESTMAEASDVSVVVSLEVVAIFAVAVAEEERKRDDKVKAALALLGLYPVRTSVDGEPDTVDEDVILDPSVGGTTN